MKSSISDNTIDEKFIQCIQYTQIDKMFTYAVHVQAQTSLSIDDA